MPGKFYGENDEMSRVRQESFEILHKEIGQEAAGVADISGERLRGR